MLLGVGCDIVEIARIRTAMEKDSFLAVHKEKVCVLSAVEILADAAGAPICSMTGLQVEVSISHEKEYAIAYAAAVKE